MFTQSHTYPYKHTRIQILVWFSLHLKKKKKEKKDNLHFVIHFFCPSVAFCTTNTQSILFYLSATCALSIYTVKTLTVPSLYHQWMVKTSSLSVLLIFLQPPPLTPAGPPSFPTDMYLHVTVTQFCPWCNSWEDEKYKKNKGRAWNEVWEYLRG